MSEHPASKDAISDDGLIILFAGMAFAGVLWAKRGSVLAALQHQLSQIGVTTDRGVEVPGIGTLDAPRILMIVGTILIVGTTLLMYRAARQRKARKEARETARELMNRR